MTTPENPEYSILARIYDALMDDVDYESWADFIDEIIQTHFPDARSVLELACGTGSVALSLDELECYDIVATDKSADMIKVARKKASDQQASVQFRVMDFLNINLDRTFDIVFSTFDSINYLRDPAEVVRLLDQTRRVLNPNSLLIFDFTTPKNSIKAIKYLNNEEGYTSDHYRFLRKSSYDARKRIHYNTFNIEKLDEHGESIQTRYQEMHEQRIYTLKEMLDIISETDYTLIAKYDGFDLVDADDTSLRITVVLRCPKTP